MDRAAFVQTVKQMTVYDCEMTRLSREVLAYIHAHTEQAAELLAILREHGNGALAYHKWLTEALQEKPSEGEKT